MSERRAAPRMSLRTILGFAAGSLPLSAVGTAMGISVQPYYAQDLGLGLIPIAIAFFIVRIVDSFVDPALAVAMDGTRTPFGRYRPWMLVGMPVLMVAVYQLFMAKPGIDLTYLMIWYFVFALGTSTVGLSRGAWSANLITRYDQRSRFYGYLGFISVIGTLVVLGTPVVSSSLAAIFHIKSRPNDVQLMGWTILALTPIGTAITAFFVHEPITVNSTAQRFRWQDFRDILRKPEVIRLSISQFALTLSPGWMGNLYVFFFTAARGFTQPQAYLLLILYVMSGVLGAPLIGYLGGRFSKHRTMIATTIGYSLGLCTVVVAPERRRAAWPHRRRADHDLVRVHGQRLRPDDRGDDGRRRRSGAPRAGQGAYGGAVRADGSRREVGGGGRGDHLLSAARVDRLSASVSRT